MALWLIASVGSMLLCLLFFHIAMMWMIRHVPLLINTPQLADLISSKLEERKFGAAVLKEKLLAPSVYAGLLPQIEAHVDHFLNVKLKEQMPVVGMMVGDRTIAQMKGIFLNELELLFPEVMEGYLSGIEQDADLKNQITEKLIHLTSGIAADLSDNLWHKWKLKGYGLAMIAGLLISLFNLIIIFLIKP